MRISVVIPTYNRAHVVCRAIDSVLHQTRQPEEIIVVDDGSTDNTFQMLNQRYGSQIALHPLDNNRGVSAARNTAVQRSTGDWLAFLDSDDEWLPQKLESQQKRVEQSQEPLCHTNEIWIRNGVRVNPMNKHAKQGGDIFHRCVEMCVISPSSVLLNKTLLSDAGGFDETLPACEDYDLWLKLTAKTQVQYIDEPLLIKYGGHEDQLSRKYWGMDRFRIQSLNNLMNSESLDDQQLALVKKELKSKLSILRKGALKHKNAELVAYCDELNRSIL